MDGNAVVHQRLATMIASPVTGFRAVIPIACLVFAVMRHAMVVGTARWHRPRRIPEFGWWEETQRGGARTFDAREQHRRCGDGCDNAVYADQHRSTMLSPPWNDRQGEPPRLGAISRACLWFHPGSLCEVAG